MSAKLPIPVQHSSSTTTTANVLSSKHKRATHRLPGRLGHEHNRKAAARTLSRARHCDNKNNQTTTLKLCSRHICHGGHGAQMSRRLSH